MPQATSLRDLLRIRQANADNLRSLAGFMGSAVGYKWDEANSAFALDANGACIPAVLIFVQKKIPQGAMPADQLVPSTMTGPDGLICATDVVTGSMPDDDKSPPPLSLENQRLVKALDSGQGGVIGGMELWTSKDGGMSSYTGTGACVVRQRATGKLCVLTNQHVAKNKGQTVNCSISGLSPLGKTTDSILIAPATPDNPDDLESFTDAQQRLDCGLVQLSSAALPLAQSGVYSLPALGPVYSASIDSMAVIGQKVLGLGQKRGLQRGTIIAYGYEWETADDDIAPYATNYLIVGEGKQPFASQGDSGKLILTDDNTYRPIALLWGGEEENFWGGSAQQVWNYASDIGQVLQQLNVEIY